MSRSDEIGPCKSDDRASVARGENATSATRAAFAAAAACSASLPRSSRAAYVAGSTGFTRKTISLAVPSATRQYILSPS